MQKTFETPGAVSLDVRMPSGDIEIDPTLEGRVQVELIAHDEESQALVDAARVDLRPSGDGYEIVIDVPSKSRGFGLSLLFGRQGISCLVRCPRGADLKVRTKSADLTSRGTLGTVRVSTASGAVQLRDLDGSLDVKSASGDVSTERVAGYADIQTASGDVRLERVGGRLSVNAVSGDVWVAEPLDEASVTTVSGDQQFDAVFGGSINSRSVSGDVQIAVRQGARVYLDCNTISGDTSSDLEMTGEPVGDGLLIDIRAKTVSGDIRITRAPAPADNAQEVHA